SKSVAAGETIIDTMGGNCDPCGYSKPHYDPCKPQETKVVHPSSCTCHEGNNCGCHQDNHHDGHKDSSCNCGCNCSYDNYNQSKPYRKSNYALYNRL
uniref:hypothetical protein n=1 Tax=Paraclostridium bifermentans TaxID=1490 RepID=UPI00359CA115